MPVLRGRRFGPIDTRWTTQTQGPQDLSCEIGTTGGSELSFGRKGLWLVGFWSEVLLVMSNSKLMKLAGNRNPHQHKNKQMQHVYGLFFSWSTSDSGLCCMWPGSIQSDQGTVSTCIGIPIMLVPWWFLFFKSLFVFATGCWEMRINMIHPQNFTWISIYDGVWWALE